MLDFCNAFIESYDDINKELKESEAFIKNLQRQVKARKITTEGIMVLISAELPHK